MAIRMYAVFDDSGVKTQSITLDLAKLVDEGAAEPVIEREIISLVKGHIARIISDGMVIYELGPFEDRDELIKALDAHQAKAVAVVAVTIEAQR